MSIRTASMASETTEALYKEAIKIIHSRRRPQRPTQTAQNLSANKSGTPGLKGLPGIAGMERWLDIIGYKMADINRLNIIHVAGTKGKGSTCAWTESFLRTFGQEKQPGGTGFPRKTGLYTSPHLIHPEERIRINFQPISREKFVEYFFDVWTRLSNAAAPSDNDQQQQRLPRYLQLLLLTALHAFKREGVDAAVIETHHGGEFDSTNVVEKPVVTVVTPLGFDHVEQLGPTIENIAWHKAGIFKRGSRALCSPQNEHPSTLPVLRQRALDKGSQLEVVEVDKDSSELPLGAPQLTLEVQRANCALGLATARAFLEEMAAVEPSVKACEMPIEKAVAQFYWPGRFQKIRSDNTAWYLDSAHNDMSIVQAVRWFTELVKPTKQDEKRRKRAVIFGQDSNHRDPITVLQGFSKALEGFPVDYALFTIFPGQRSLESNPKTNFAETYSELWTNYHPDTTIFHNDSVEDTLRRAETLSSETDGGLDVLVTGSQVLTGGALKYLNHRI